MQQNRELMRGEEARKALVDFLPFLIKYHPIDKCRESFVELRALLADVWPEGAPEPTDFGAFERWRPCGDLVTWDTWGACRGSASDLRGFSCGFWQLLHGMTMGIGDDDAQPFVRAVGDFMMHLFGCHNCGEHFQKAALSPKSGALVQTGKDLVLWMWRIHNIVNNFTAPWSDPAFPKQQWPGPGLCWQCSKNGGRPDKDGRVQWIDDQVHLFLVDFYGYVLEGGQVRHISGSEGKQSACEVAQAAWGTLLGGPGVLPGGSEIECAPSLHDLTRCGPCSAHGGPGEAAADLGEGSCLAPPQMAQEEACAAPSSHVEL